MSDRHDFDFLTGQEWVVENRVLRDRLVGSRDWDTFEARLFGVDSILGGFGQVDRFEGVRNGEEFAATSLRIYDPTDDLWRIYWGDTLSYRIVPQVEGRFEGGVGVFQGEDRFDGRRVPLRFVWRDTDREVPLWEQAYLDGRTGEWETNWVMRFVRCSLGGPLPVAT